MSQGAQGTAVMPAGMSAVQPPVIEAVLPAVARALADELGSATPAVRVVRASRRDHSLTWELEAERSRYILKWLPRRASRELELARLTSEVFAGDPGIRTPRVACNPTRTPEITIDRHNAAPSHPS